MEGLKQAAASVKAIMIPFEEIKAKPVHDTSHKTEEHINPMAEKDYYKTDKIAER
jgi:hypothetical protein